MKTAVVVLGHVYHKKYKHSARQTKRLNKGIEVHAEVNADFILTTGGTGRNFNNTNTPMSVLMSEYLKQHGIAEEKIRYETKSTNTIENAWYLKPVIRELGVEKMIIVTSWDHMLRAGLIFRDVYPHMAIEFVVSDFFGGWWWTIFDPVWHTAGLIKYFLVKGRGKNS